MWPGLPQLKHLPPPGFPPPPSGQSREMWPGLPQLKHLPPPPPPRPPPRPRSGRGIAYARSERLRSSRTLPTSRPGSSSDPNLPRLSRSEPRTRVARASLSQIVASTATWSHSSFQKLITIVPVSSPTSPSQTRPPLSISRGSSIDSTLTAMLTRLLRGVNSSILIDCAETGLHITVEMHPFTHNSIISKKGKSHNHH